MTLGAHDQAREHARFCDDCDVDFPTWTGHLCERGRALAGCQLPPRHECVANSDDPCDNCRKLDAEERKPLDLRRERHVDCDCSCCLPPTY